MEDSLSHFPPSLRSLEIICDWAWAYPQEHELDWDDAALTISGLVSLQQKEQLPHQLCYLTLAMSLPSQTSSSADPRINAITQATSYFTATATKFKVINPPARRFSTLLHHSESDEEWIERLFDENDRRLLLRVAGLRLPLYIGDKANQSSRAFMLNFNSKRYHFPRQFKFE